MEIFKRNVCGGLPFRWSETIIFGVHSNFTYDRSSHWQVFFEISVPKNWLSGQQFFKKRFQHRCFTVKYAKFLRTSSLWKTSCGCFCYDSETYHMVNFICLLILVSFQFKLYIILINLVNIYHLIYRIQEKAPKIKKTTKKNQYTKSYLFICSFNSNRN